METGKHKKPCRRHCYLAPTEEQQCGMGERHATVRIQAKQERITLIVKWGLAHISEHWLSSWRYHLGR